MSVVDFQEKMALWNLIDILDCLKGQNMPLRVQNIDCQYLDYLFYIQQISHLD